MNMRYLQLSFGHNIRPPNKKRSKKRELKFLVDLEK